MSGRLVIYILLAALVAGLAWLILYRLFHPVPATAQRQPKPKKSPMKDMAGTAATAIIILIVLCIWVFPMFNGSDEGKIIEDEIESLGKAMDAYQSEFGALPVGNHREISRALRGENPSKRTFTELARVADNGRLLDPWEHPYQFFVSNDGFVIRSAGPDKKFQQGGRGESDDFIYASN